jgi:hypothetical protein
MTDDFGPAQIEFEAALETEAAYARAQSTGEASEEITWNQYQEALAYERDETQ